MNEIADAFNQLYLYTDNNLDLVGATLVQDKASTGYNFKTRWL